MKTCKAFEKSNAPMYVALGTHPNHFELATYAMTKEEAEEHIKPESFMISGLLHGEMLCAVIPLGFFYGDEENKTVYDPSVTMEDMVNMMQVQSDIDEGIMPKMDVSEFKVCKCLDKD